MSDKSEKWKSLLHPETVDSHFHILEMEKKGLDVQLLLDQAFSAGIAYALDIAVDTGGFEQRLSYDARYPYLYHTAGISPASADSEDQDQLIQQVKEQSSHSRVVAIGEIGLDWYWDYGSRKDQKRLFIRQLELAAEQNLPVVVHCRDADTDMIDILSRYRPDRCGIIHCFSSGPEEASAYAELGFMVSFAGNVTFKKSTPLQDAARRLPPDKLLLETDAPYLSPQPVRGSLNHPGQIAYTVEFVASLRSTTPEKLLSQIQQNFTALFRLKQ